MVDFGSILDRSRDALLAAVGQAASGANDPVVPPQDESLLSGLLPRSFGHDAGLDMDLDFAFNDAPARMADWRNVMLWMVALVVCVVIAASTNPNEASFRSYLTELSFRRHLVDIRTDDAPAELPSTSHANDETGKSDTSTTPVTPSASLAVSSHHASNGSDTPIAPFRFANHVSISLRTPTLYYKTLYLASVALTSPLGPPTFLSDPITLVRNRGHVQKERLVLYVGYLGHWVQLGIVPRRLEWFWRTWFDGGKEKEKRKKADRAGVMDMRAIQTKDEPVNKNATLAPPTKHVRRIGSNSDLSSTSHPAPLPIPTFPDSRRASIVSILPPSDTADTSPAVIALKADLTKAQDALSELKNQLLSHEQSVSDAHASLQATLDDLRTKRKEDDAERSEIKSKTKSLEEQKRQAEAGKREAEKKLKMAEGARDAVAAKIEGARKEMSDCRERIEASERAARTVTEEGARYVVETQEAVEVRRLEVGEAEEETRVLEQEVEGLTEKVKEAEERLKLTQTKGFMAAPSISPTTTANSAAQTAAAAAVANAIVGKNLAPEEEMMMMAAAYEVAAQEGYHPHQHTPSSGHSNTSSHAHGHQNHASTQQHGLSSGYTAHHAALGHGHGHGHGHNNSSWATQAAAYMAEAGMPSLDQSYTARPTYPGRQISSNTASAATGTAMGEGKRLTEMMAFDDFGPGSSASHDTRDKRISGEGFGQVLGLAANRLSAQAHAHAEEDEVSEAELYGLDPASPNGGISTSFSANLLGQGLFNSLLGGDQTPTDATDDEMEDEGTTLEEALNFGPSEVASARAEGAADPEDKGENEHDSGDESGEDEWKSPHAEPRAVSAVATGPEVQNKAKRFSFSRLVPPTTSPLNPARVSSAGSNPSSAAPSQHAHIPTALPGLPSLPAVPASRRWFSGTMSASAENLHSFPYHAPLAQSSDSLASHTHTLPGGHAPGNNVNHANPGSGASTTTAGSLYESSPFAPSESERKKLMGLGGMWGQMGMGGLGKRFSTGAAHAQAIQGQGKDEGLGRSTSLDLASHARGQSAPVPQARQFGPASGNNVNANAQGAMTGTSPQSQQSWMARHLHLQSSLGNGAFSSNDSSNTASTQPVPITSSSSPSGGMRSFFGSSPNSKLGSSPNATFGGLSTSPSTRFGDALHSGSGVQATNSLNIGNDEGEPDKDKKDKERFKLFASLRKPSAAKLGSSPGAQSSTSSASNQG